MGQPTSAEVASAFGVQKRVPKSLLPPHPKPQVTPINFEAPHCLPNKTPARRKFLQNALPWIHDGSRYGNAELKPKAARFSFKRFAEMKEHKHKPLYGLPEGFAGAFLRTEPSKKPDHKHGLRLRPPFAPDMNETAATTRDATGAGNAYEG